MGDSDDAIRIGSIDHIAFVNLAQAKPARQGRDDTGMAKFELGAIDRSLIALARSQKLLHQGGLCVNLLLRDGVLLVQQLIALQIALCVLELGRVLRLLTQGLIQLHLIAAWVNLRQQVALCNLLPILEGNFLQFAIDLAAHGHGIECGDRAYGLECVLDGRNLGGCHTHRYGHAGHGAAAKGVGPAGCWAGIPVRYPVHAGGQHQHKNQPWQP